jgi:hypothetical protein
MFKSIWFSIAVLWFMLGILVFLRLTATATATAITNQSNYTSIQVRRMPCGRILRREVVHENDAWRKTVTLIDTEGRVVATKTKTIEPEQCAQIQAGKFVPSLWKDCNLSL